MTINPILNTPVTALLTKTNQPENFEPPTQPAPQNPAVANDSDGDNDGSGIDIKA